MADGRFFWAHIMWHRHGLRMEEFCEMEPSVRRLYIASELLREEEARKSRQ